MKQIIKLERISKKFNNQVVLKELSLEIIEGNFTAIVGPSGSGKSTLLNIMSGLSKPSSGRVFFEEDEITKYNENKLADLRRIKFGQVFQNYFLLSHLTIEENIKIGLNPNGDNYSFEEIVETLDIKSVLKKFPSSISGGQQQRAGIARAIIKKPRVLFCDEATGALDEENSRMAISLIHNIKEKYGITVVFITHNHEIAKTAERIITVTNGEIHKDIINSNQITAKEMNWV